MNSTLEEIRQLLQMRKNPGQACHEVRQLAHKKLRQISRRIDTLSTLQNALTLLVNLCRRAEKGCPIIEGIEAAK